MRILIALNKEENNKRKSVEECLKKVTVKPAKKKEVPESEEASKEKDDGDHEFR